MSARPRRIRETRGAASERIARALRRVVAATIALAALAASACGYGEPPPPSPNPEPPAVSSPVASAARTPPPAPSPAPTPEPKIDVSQAALVRVGETVVGEVETHGGFDLFRFRADEGRWYQVDAARRSLGDSMLELYDSNGQPLGFSDNYPGQNWAARAVWRAPAAGDYYAKVSSPYKVDLGTYNFSVVEVDIADEHGDSEGDATGIAVGTVVESALEHRADSDWFRFQAEAGVLYEIYALSETVEDVYERVILKLYDFHGETLNSSFWSIMVSEDGKLFWKATKSGDHYVEVGNDYFVSEIPYSLTVAPSNVVDDHPDNSMAATRISSGTLIGGSIDYKGDSDCFRFRAEGGRTYRIEVIGETLWNTQTILYGGGGETLASARYPDSHNAPGIVWKAPGSGDYYVRVGSVNNAVNTHPYRTPPAPPCEAGFILPPGPPGTYTLEVAEFSVPDDYPDDAPATIPLGYAAAGALDHPNDVDNFRFEAEKGRVYTILLTRGTLTDVWAHMYVEGGVATIERERVWKARSDRTYDISVRSYIGDTGTYNLEIIPTVSDTGADIVDDHADDRENATRIALGETAEGRLDYENDEDYFVFPAEAGKFYGITLKGGSLMTGSLLMDVRKPNGYVLQWRVYNPGDDPALWFVWEAPESGDYRVRMSSRYSQPALGTYSFAVDLADFTDDHANEKENATRVSLGETASGSVDYSGDYDYFVFQAEAGREYSIRAEPIGMGNIRLEVHDFRQQIASARDESGAPAVLRWTAPASRDYYVEATARENEIGAYRLTLE